MGDTIIIARVLKIEDRDTIDIIARVLHNKDRNSVAIAIVGDSADATIVARDLDIEDCNSVAIVIVGDSTIGSHGQANVAAIHNITGPRADVVTTNDLAIDTRARIDTRTQTRANVVDIDDHNRGQPTPSAPSTPLPN